MLGRYVANISDEQVEADKRVREARRELEAAERQHADFAKKLAGLDTLLPRTIDG